MTNAMHEPNPNPSFSNFKGTDYETQLLIVKQYLTVHTASRFMVSVYTDIPIQNVCRHVATLAKQKSIAVVKKDYCAISRKEAKMTNSFNTSSGFFDPNKDRQNQAKKIYDYLLIENNLEIIENAIYSTDNLGLVIIDGIADLITGYNDEEQAIDINTLNK